jgi:hypothetical protein
LCASATDQQLAPRCADKGDHHVKQIDKDIIFLEIALRNLLEVQPIAPTLETKLAMHRSDDPMQDVWIALHNARNAIEIALRYLHKIADGDS